MTIYPLAAAIIVSAAVIYACVRRAPRALLTLTCEKIGRAPKNSRLKQEWISPARLERTLKTLERHGFKTIFPSILQHPVRLPEKPVLLAFMGGYRAFYTEVFPLLQKYNAKACVFLAQEYVGSYNAWQDPYQEPWQNLLTAQEIKNLQESGLIEFGALDVQARDLTLLPEKEARFGAEENIFRLKKQLGIEASAFAFWPAGKWDEKTAKTITNGLNLPVFTPILGINNIKTKTFFLKTLPAKSLRARRELWTRR